MRKAPFVAGLFVACLLSGCAQIQTTRNDSILSTQEKNVLARKAYEGGNPGRAIDLYRQVLSEENWNRKANYNLSIVHLELAIEGFEFIGQFIDNSTDARVARAHLDRAVENIEKYLAISKNYSVVE